VTVTVLLVAPAGIDAGAKTTVTPAGAPDVTSATSPAKPPLRVNEIAELPPAPAAKFTITGLAVSAIAP
jgi:hypothetical protein